LVPSSGEDFYGIGALHEPSLPKKSLKGFFVVERKKLDQIHHQELHRHQPPLPQSHWHLFSLFVDRLRGCLITQVDREVLRQRA
jgi:hypothetical protein